MKSSTSLPKPSVFLAFPEQPPPLSETILSAIDLANVRNGRYTFRGWPETDIAGRPLTDPILTGIGEASFVVADVTFLNFNVTYEVGISIGSQRRAYLVRNQEYRDDRYSISKVGIFDTLGYVDYVDADSLAKILLSAIDTTPLVLNPVLDIRAPVYVLETPYRGDAMNQIISCVKKARLQYRSFSPSEDARMSAPEAIRHIANSHGVIVPLLSPHYKNADIHNVRAAFVAGLAHGMEKPTLILQSEGALVPLDIRDFTKSFRHLEDINDHINSLSLDIVASIQQSDPIVVSPQGKLANLDIGDPMAENEFQTLDQYYLRRSEYTRTIRGDANVVFGRKGAGKTALFSQVRNHLRRDKARIIVDLKPEGYQLVKLKEMVLAYLTAGTKLHMVTAFWEYALLLEVAYKLLEKDKIRHMRDHLLFPLYTGLKDSYFNSPNAIQGDFSERLLELSSTFADEYETRFGREPSTSLTADQIAQVLYSGSLQELQDQVSAYLEHKKDVWILFDNLDKGWSVPGPSSDDILILRCLIDAARKLQREMQRREHAFHSIVFIRNDVYQLLMMESSDFGKEMPVSLDWNDAEMLREMLRLRLVRNGFDPETDFYRIWTNLCVSHYRAQETSQFMIDRCLMRPRNLLKIFSHCMGSAVNFRRKKIEPEDIEKGMVNYSNDLIIEADQELANIETEAEGLLYHFIGEDWSFSDEELCQLFEEHSLPKEKYENVINFLLYFGFLGVSKDSEESVFIFDVGYDMRKLEVLVAKHGAHVNYTLNPAFWPGLGVGPK